MRFPISLLCIQVLWFLALTACGGGGGGGHVPLQPPVDIPADTEFRAPSYFAFSPWPNDTAPTLVDTSSNSGTRVTNLTSDNMGGWYVSFLVNGRPGSVHLTAEHAHPSGRDWNHQFGDLYVQLGFIPFEHFDIVRVFASYDGDEVAGAYLYGDPTPSAGMPPGTAVYTGTLRRFSTHSYFDAAREQVTYTEVGGDITLTADFANDTFTGIVDNIVIDADLSGRTRWDARPDTAFAVSSGTISESVFSGRVAGTGYFSGFTGDIVGAFYGPDADEAGGVITAQSGSTDLFRGAFSADRTDLSTSPGLDLDTVNSAIGRNNAVLLDALALAARSTPNFGSVTQSSNRDPFRTTTDRVTTSFDGSTLIVNVDRADRPDLRFGAAGRSAGWPRRPIVERDDTVTVAILDVEPANATALDYLAFGTWIHVTGNVDNRIILRSEVGSFVDVPDHVVAVTTWSNGGATYTGSATGVYAVRYGTDDEDIPEGSYEYGSYAGEAKLTARFTTGVGGSIEGCFGCGTPVTIDGVFFDADTREEMDVDLRSSDYAMYFSRVGFDETGKFTGNFMAVQTPNFSVGSETLFQNIGTWGGAFYGESDFLGGAFPGRVVGTFGAEAETPGGTRGGFLGSFWGRPGPLEL